MKRLSLAALMVALIGTAAIAANPTPTPVVGPNETGENSAGAQQIMDMARIKQL